MVVENLAARQILSQTKTACENVRPRKFDLLTTDNVCFVVGLSVVLSFDLLGTQRRDAVGEALVSVFVVLFFNQSNESRLLLDIPPLSCFCPIGILICDFIDL